MEDNYRPPQEGLNVLKCNDQGFEYQDDSQPESESIAPILAYFYLRMYYLTLIEISDKLIKSIHPTHNLVGYGKTHAPKYTIKEGDTLKVHKSTYNQLLSTYNDEQDLKNK